MDAVSAALPTVLVTGFGSFPGVPRNPTERLAHAVDGAIVAGHRVHGLVLPVEYERGPRLAIEAARALGARIVLGTGVAAGRAGPCWELVGVRVVAGPVDTAGSTATGLRGPARVATTLAPGRAATFAAAPSTDAGGYVCNAWVHAVASALPVPVGFLHVPADGYPAWRLLTALTAVVSELARGAA